jgi:hypothetical protein
MWQIKDLYPYKTIGKLAVLNILFFSFLDSRQADKRFRSKATLFVLIGKTESRN